MKQTIKKAMSILLAVTFFFSSFALGVSNVNQAGFAVKAKALETFTEGYYTYTVDENGNATITEVDESISGSITVPSAFGVHTVVNIGDGAFSCCESITSITIPNSVTSIGYDAFNSCSNLTSVILPDNIRNIGESSFLGTSLYNDPSNWENNVLYIGNYLIEEKLSIDSLYSIKDGTIGVADGAFRFCSNLTSITIPDSVKFIGDGAFSGCRNLASVTIPDSVTIMGDDVFSQCDNLKKAVLGNGLTSISNNAFWLCQSLESVTISDSVTNICEEAFFDCFSLRSVIIPDSVTDIGCFAFGASGITNLILPDSVVTLGDGAFLDCEYLEYVHISKSVKKFELYRNSINNKIDIFGKSSAYICSDTYDCLAKEYADENGIEFRLCDGNHSDNTPENPATTQPTIKPVTTLSTAPSTIRPTSVPTTIRPTEISTTKPAVTKPSTTRPAEDNTATTTQSQTDSSSDNGGGDSIVRVIIEFFENATMKIIGFFTRILDIITSGFESLSDLIA